MDDWIADGDGGDWIADGDSDDEDSEQEMSDWEQDDDSSQCDAIETDASEHHDGDGPSTGRSSIEPKGEDRDNLESQQPAGSVEVVAFEEDSTGCTGEVTESIAGKEVAVVDKTVAETEVMAQEGSTSTHQAYVTDVVDAEAESAEAGVAEAEGKRAMGEQGDGKGVEAEATPECSPGGDAVGALEVTPVLDPGVGEGTWAQSNMPREASEAGVESGRPDDVGEARLRETIGT